jgi:Histidine kinase-, DNA gyrase B-, and HSP90-like ATPase
VQIEVFPVTEHGRGWVRNDDNGEGMIDDKLVEAMRWGGKGPKAKREASDLGRFGLGLKTLLFVWPPAHCDFQNAKGGNRLSMGFGSHRR